MSPDGKFLSAILKFYLTLLVFLTCLAVAVEIGERLGLRCVIGLFAGVSIGMVISALLGAAKGTN